MIKKILFLLTFIITVSVAAGYAASDIGFAIYENDFEKFTVSESNTDGIIKTYGKSNLQTVSKPLEGGAGVDDGNTVLKFGNEGNSEGGFTVNLPEIKSGKVAVIFDIYFENTKRSVRIPEFYQNDVYTFEAICTSNLIGASYEKGKSVYLKSAAKEKHWYKVYITADTDEKKFSVSYDGNILYTSDGSEFFKYSSDNEYITKLLFKYMATPGEACCYIDNLRVMSFLESDFFGVDGNVIKGVKNNMDADEVISYLEYPKNAVLTVFTKNGLERKGNLRQGDYLLVKTPQKTAVYNFSYISLQSLYSDTFQIDTKNFEITDIKDGITGDEIIKSVKGAEFYEFFLYDKDKNEKALNEKIIDSDILKIKISPNESYDFTLKKIKTEDVLIFDRFDGNKAYNFYGNFEPDIKDGSLKISDEKTSNLSVRRYFKPESKIFITDFYMYFNYNEEVKGSSKFSLPAFMDEDGYKFELALYNKNLFYTSKDGNNVSADIKLEPEKKYFIRVILNTSDDTFSLYIDDEMIFENVSIPTGSKNINRLEFCYYNSENQVSYDNSLYIDELSVYDLKSDVGALYCENENEVKMKIANNSFPSEELSENDIILENENGEIFQFSLYNEGNVYTLKTEKKLIDGNYKIIIFEKEYRFLCGNAPYEINYMLSEKKGKNISAEFSLTNKTKKDKDALIYAVLYDSDNKVTDVLYKNPSLLKNSVYEDNFVFENASEECSFIKMFLWDKERELIPLGKSKMQEFYK